MASDANVAACGGRRVDPVGSDDALRASRDRNRAGAACDGRHDGGAPLVERRLSADRGGARAVIDRDELLAVRRGERVVGADHLVHHRKRSQQRLVRIVRGEVDVADVEGLLLHALLDLGVEDGRVGQGVLRAGEFGHDRFGAELGGLHLMQRSGERGSGGKQPQSSESAKEAELHDRVLLPKVGCCQ